MLLSSCTNVKQKLWEIADNPLVTEWALQIDTFRPWNNYPRPDMKRKEWMNLNGLWDYAITQKGAPKPELWEGKILVPYPIESSLSGVKRRVSENETIWYRTTFRASSKWKGKRMLLNFEASDWETTVWVNGTLAGSHKGGYDPFSFDITEMTEADRSVELIVSVWDPTDKGSQPRGKQVANPGGIWYTPTSGIWQTVWIEPVSTSHIGSFRTYTSTEDATITVKPSVVNADDCNMRLTVSKSGKILGSVENEKDGDLTVKIEDPVLWTPDNPFLYDLKIEMIRGAKVVDMVTSVTGIRKVSLGKTDDGFTRILLNDEFIFQNGPLDQGFWPDGLYTPPTEEAMIYDLWMLKKMGFNMLRKHVKVENRIFYNWCDKIGLLVWQDMPNGDRHISGDMPDVEKDPADDLQFRKELGRMIDTKFNFSSIIVWVPFNEGWGQYNTEGITQFIREKDQTRLVNSASGWTDRGTGDMNDIHNYPEPRAPMAEESRAIVLGEFGGLGLPIENHTWEQRNWGYRNMTNREDLLLKYEEFYNTVHKLVSERGLSASVYTQTTDVETETNGLMTYDRKINKMGADNIYKAHKGLIPPFMVNNASIFLDTFYLELACQDTSAIIRYTTDGSEPGSGSKIYTLPVSITSSSSIRAKAWYNGETSRTVSFSISRVEPLPPVEKNENITTGLSVKLFEGRFDMLPNFDSIDAPVKMFSAGEVSHLVSGLTDRFALLFEGFVDVPETGIYGFFVTSDDGSRLYIGDEIIVENDGIHGMVEESGFVALGKGMHPVRLEYFQRTGGVGLSFQLEAPGREKGPIPRKWMYHIPLPVK